MKLLAIDTSSVACSVALQDDSDLYVRHEEQARERYGDIRILRWPYSENDRAQTDRSVSGTVKVITRPNGRIVGASIVGRNASELIALWALAISQKHTVKSLTGTVLPYPTLSETAKRVAVTYYTPKLDSPWIKRLIRFRRLLPTPA